MDKGLITNYQSNKLIALSHAKDIAQICKPLFELLNIHGFTFQRMYRDGSRLYFSSCETWIENFYDNNYFLASSFQKFSQLQTFNLWKHWPKEDKSFYKLMADAKENFNYENGLVIIRSHDGYMDAFTLRGYLNDESVNSRYLSEFNPIEKFIDYFYVAAADLIANSFEKKISIPESVVKPLYKTTPLGKHDIKLQKFFSSLKPEKILINNGTKNFFLTKRESECLGLLARGQSAKETGRSLGISSRTVESYLDSIKTKLSCTSRSQIFDLVLSNPLNQDLILDIWKKNA